MRLNFNRAIILAEGLFGEPHSKTAVGLIRYSPEKVVCVLDSTKAGYTTKDIVGIQDIPIVGNIIDAMKFEPDSLIIGIAPIGGGFPEEWKSIVITGIRRGLDVISGLHYFLSEDPDIMSEAEQNGVNIIDVRKPSDNLTVSSDKLKDFDGVIVHTVGSDCSVGKMTTSIELARFAAHQGLKSKFIATGQTGIMIEGDGIPADRIISDFLAGAIEAEIMKYRDYEFISVEGQGSIIHPAYSGVTLGLLHGCAPSKLVLCHQLGRDTIEGYNRPIPPLRELIFLYERLAGYIKEAKVAGVALNTWGYGEKEALKSIQKLEEDLGVPVTDPVRFGIEKLFRAIMED